MSLLFCELIVRIPEKKIWRVRVAPDLFEGDVVQVVDVPLAHAVMRKENVWLLDQDCLKRVPETTNVHSPLKMSFLGCEKSPTSRTFTQPVINIFEGFYV